MLNRFGSAAHRPQVENFLDNWVQTLLRANGTLEQPHAAEPAESRTVDPATGCHIGLGSVGPINIGWLVMIFFTHDDTYITTYNNHHNLLKPWAFRPCEALPVSRWNVTPGMKPVFGLFALAMAGNSNG